MWDQDRIESDHQAESQPLPQDSRSSRAEQIRLLIVGEQPVFQEGLSLILAAQSDVLVIGNATTFSGAIEQFRWHMPNVTLLDHCLQDATGSEMQLLTTLTSEFPGACIIVLTTAEGDAEIQRAFRAGASSCVLKTTRKSKLLETIRSTYRRRRCIPREVAARLAEHLGTEELTAREIDVLRLIRDGNRNKQIAGRLAIAETTVNFHIKNFVAKLQANDRAHAIAITFRRVSCTSNRVSGEHGFMPIRINPSMIRLTIGTLLCAPSIPHRSRGDRRSVARRDRNAAPPDDKYRNRPGVLEEEKGAEEAQSGK